MIKFLILLLITILPCQAETLKGYISNDQADGHIGIRVNINKVIYVHPESPAMEAGIKEGDIVLFVDGVKYYTHDKDIIGEPETYVLLTIKRKKEQLVFYIKRVDYRTIKP